MGTRVNNANLPSAADAEAIRVVQATAWYLPHSIGGTEVYVEGLVRGLHAHGVQSTVLVPRHPKAGMAYHHAGAHVVTYPVNAEPTFGELRGGEAHSGFENFRAALKGCNAQIYHQHSWTRGCGPNHLIAARKMGLKTLVTVHVPGNVCVRGTMLRFGERACEGRVDDILCGACWAHGRGLPVPLAKLIARVPVPVARRAHEGGVPFGTTRLSGAVAARAMGAKSVESVRIMIENADYIVPVCQWLHEALVARAAPREKLKVSRQGLDPAVADALAEISRPERGAASRQTVRLLYVGRWDRVKGIDVTVQAVRALPPSVDVQFSIHAVSITDDQGAYERHVRDLAADDPRISIRPPVARAEVAALFAQHDVLLVPSLWLETGPLVVLEAKAAGLFVLGSRRGGIAELVGDEPGGELVEPGDVSAWCDAIARLCGRQRDGKLQAPPRNVRTMGAVASEMSMLYRSLLQ